MSYFLHETLHRDLTGSTDQQITVCGAGALGANLAETLARMGFRQLRVIDRDRIEAHNLSTQPWSVQDIGASKARVLASTLYQAVEARVDPQITELTDSNARRLLHGSAVVVDAFDNIAARSAVSTACNELALPCLHLALAGSGQYGCGLWDAEYQLAASPPAENRACAYPLTRPLAQMVAAAGAEVVVRFLKYGRRTSFELTLDDLRLSTT